MGDTRTVTAKLVFGADKTAQADILASAKKIKEALVDLGAQAVKLENQIKDAWKAGNANEAHQLTTELDKVKSKMGELQAGAQKALAEEYVRSAKKAAEQTKQLGEQLGQISTRVAAVGVGIGVAFYQASQKYTQGAGQNEAVGQRWLATTKQIEESQTSLGRSATQALQPWMETLAGISKWAAEFAAKHPGGVQAILTGGLGLAAVGGLGTLLAEGIKITADLKMLGAAAMQNSAADKMLEAAGIQAGAAVTGGAVGVASEEAVGGAAAVAGGVTAAGVGVAIAGGMLLGGAVNEVLARTVGGPFQTFGKWLTVGAYGLGKLAGGEQTAKEWAVAVAGSTGEIDANTKAQMDNTLAQQRLKAAADEAAKAVHIIKPADMTAALDQFSKYQASVDTAGANYKATTGDENTAYYAAVKDKNDAYAAEVARTTADFYDSQNKAKTKFEDQQKQTTADFQASQIKAYETHIKDLSKTAEQFSLSEARTEQDYYARRLDEAQKFGEETARMEADHQTQMRRMSQDNSVEIDDLSRSRDALGIVKALRQQERDRQRAEEDYHTQASRKNTDFAKQMADEEQQFAKERGRRLDDYALKLKDANEAYDAQAKDAQDAFKKQQDAANKNFAQQWIDANTAFNNQAYQRMTQHDSEMTQLATQHTDKMSKLQTLFEDEKTKLKNQLVDALNAIDPYILGMQKKVQADLEKNSIEFGKFIAAMKFQMAGGQGYTASGLTLAERKQLGLAPSASDVYKALTGDNLSLTNTGSVYHQNSGPYVGHADGGYASFGKYLLGEGGRTEFVLSGKTTSAAEQVIGGRLSQENLMAGLISGRSGGQSINLGGITINGGSEEEIVSRVTVAVAQQVRDGIRKAKEQRRGRNSGAISV